MRALLKRRGTPGLELREVPIPVPPPGWARIAVRAAGVCGSDIPIIDGRREVPDRLIPGHEIAGEVAAVASPDDEAWLDAPVAVGLVVDCQVCRPCRRGDAHLCESIAEIGIHRDGGFAEQVVAPIRSLVRLPTGFDLQVGSQVDPVASVNHPLRRLRPGPDDDVLIFGAGPIGLYALQVVLARGCRTATVVVRREDRRADTARALGANRVVMGSDVAELAAQVAAVTGGAEPSLVVEASGSIAALDQALDLVGSGGTIALEGSISSTALIDLSRIVRRELHLEGSICYSTEDFRASLDMLVRGRVRSVVSHTFRLDEFASALEAVRTREAVKVLLVP